MSHPGARRRERQAARRKQRFGQKPPPLIDYLKNILQQYPDGGQILKELLQNANDAEATVVKFALDERTHNADPSKLLDPNMAKYQGAALYAYNNELFKDEDWDGIQQPGQSGKKKKVLKIGRFGIGFNSVYHVTDLPSIVSGEDVAFLDPLQCNLKSTNDKTGETVELGETGEMVPLSELMEDYPHQAAVYNVLSCQTRSGHLHGTLFRFPLRQEESHLSRTIYTPEKVCNQLFDPLRAEASRILLFLTNIRQLELHVQRQDHETMQQALCVKETFVDEANVFQQKMMETFQSKGRPGVAKVVELNRQSCITVEENGKVDTQHWFIMHQLGTNHEELQQLQVELGKDTSYHVWAAVAVPVKGSLANVSSSGGSIPWLVQLPQVTGHAFCFLPMPIKTGLPVHVHGYFAVSNDRRSIKWPSSEEHGKDAIWNELLVKHALASVYIKAMSQLWNGCHFQAPEQTTVQPADQLCCAAYAAWPDAEHFTSSGLEAAPWVCLLQYVRRQLFSLPLLWSHSHGGCWLKAADAWLMQGDALATTALDVDGSLSRGVMQTVYEVMLALNEPIVLLPPHVWRTLDSEESSDYRMLLRTRTVHPPVVRQCLRKSHSLSLQHAVDGAGVLSALLEFLMHDLATDQITAELHGLRLLPTCAKGTKLELVSLGSDVLYLESSSCRMQLVPGLEAQFIDTTSSILSATVIKKLQTAAESSPSTLQILDRDSVLNLLPVSISARYPSNHDGSLVKWSPEDALSASWLKEVWHWLNAFCQDSLFSVEGLPLLPVQDRLYPLQHESTVLLPIPGQEEAVPSNILDLLEDLGCNVVRPVPNYLQHRQLMKYVCDFSHDGVTKVLHNLAMQRQSYVCSRIQENASDEQKLSLLHFVSSANVNLLRTTAEVLHRLPIFPTAAGQLKFIPLGQSSKLLPSSLPQHLLDTPVLANMLIAPAGNLQIAHMICSLGCKQLTIDELVLDILVPFGTKSPAWQSTILHFVAGKLPVLSACTLGTLSKVEFVPSASSSTLHCPCLLFDPADKTLALLLHRSKDVYPADMFSEALPSLRKMGLKTMATMSKSEKAQLVERYASSISHYSIVGEELDFNCACAMADNLLKFLMESPDLHDHEVMDWLHSSIGWLPAAPRPSADRYPPVLCWLGEDPLPTGELLYKISDLVTTDALQLQTDQQTAGLLVGSAVRLLPEELTLTVKQNRKLLEMFLRTGQDLTSCVAKHLLLVASFFVQQDHSVDKETVKTCVHHICSQVYRYLQSKLGSSQIANALQILRDEVCLWSNDAGFLKPCHVVQTLPKGIVDLEPYYYAVEPALRLFSTLFTKVGAKEQLMFADLRTVLDRVCKDISSGYLSDLQLQLCLSVLRCKDVSEEATELDEEDSVLVPTAERKLLPAMECTYRDGMFWKAVGSSIEEDDDEDFAEFNLVHPELSVQLAKTYKVQPLSTKVLPSDELDLDYEQVGQHEPLTTRLRNILHEYPNDMTVLKELIQNADDAGATEVKFMLDMRRAMDSNCRKLLHERMKAWQGPALWVYNNAVFTEDDFCNIMLLGGGTKRTTPGKIGRFGLGFCSTYHLTDVPSFVSRDSIIFLDPHCTNLEGRVNPSQPGMRIKFIKQQKGLKAFRDQFSVYTDVFGCRVVGDDSHPAAEYPHTLFRFPLRSSQHSEISNNDAMHSCKSLLKELEETSSEVLLFLQHVKKISVWQLADGSSSPKKACEIFSVSASSAQHLLGDSRCGDLLSSLLHSHEKNVIEVMEGTDKDDLPWTSYKRIITVNHPKGNSVQEEWLLCSSFGGGQSLEKAIDLSQRSEGAFLLPWTGVACRIENRRGTVYAKPVDGHVFCFLPLPRTTGFPVHVNGFFSVRSDRKGLDDEDGSNDPRVLWNHCLARDVLPRAYVQLLQSLVITMKPHLSQLETSSQDAFARSLYNVFPGARMPNISYWVAAAKEVVQLCLADPSVNVLWTLANGGQWLSLHPKHGAILFDSQLREYCERGAMEVLIRLGRNVIQTTPEDGLLKSLQLAGVSEHFTMERFFTTVFFHNLERIDVELLDDLVDGLLKFMAQNEADSESESDWWCAAGLQSCPCILASNGQHQRPANLIDLRPDNQHLLHLYEQSDGRFLHERYEQHLHVLRKWCGIISKADQLSVDDVIERAWSISRLAKTNVEEAYSRAYHFVCYLEGSAHLSNMSFANGLQDVPFLPVLPKPINWPFPWAGSESFHSPATLLPQQWAEAIGSTGWIIDEAKLQSERCQKVFSILKLQGKEPSLNQFIGQLCQLHDVSSCDKIAGPQITLCVHHIYQYFQEHIEELQSLQSTCLLPDEWVWNEKHGQFMPVNRMSVSAPDCYGDLMPYRSTIGHKSQFVALFRCMGVKETTDSTDLLNILQEIHRKSNAREQGLITEELDMVIHLLNLLCKSDSFDTSMLLLPTNDGRLLPATECTYCDRKFLRKGSDELVGSEEAMRDRVHERVESLAAKLGAVPLSQRLLPSEALDVDLDFDCVGQSEELTTRLHNILEEYPGDSTILKELMQNADDAGAERVCFVLDWRQHRSESLLHPAMAPWQGPALLAYNDAEFTPADFRNIMKLGGGTKRQELGKIGRFGLGFCSVYHLTDVPSFVSGDRVIILDPHTTNLKDRVTPNKPGMSINFVERRAQLRNFADQFLPYDGMLGCSLEERYPHTLFRLPLRQSCTRSNLISDETFNKKSMYMLLADFWKHLPKMLLFLQSVSEVAVYEISEKAGSASEMIELYHTRLCHPPQQYSAKECGRDLLRQLSNKHKEGLVDELKRQAQSKGSKVESILSMAVETKLTRYGQSCLAAEQSEKTETWLVSSCAGTRKAVEMCCSTEGRREALVPWAGCAIRLSADGEGASSIQSVDGHVFCFLPLPQDTILPIHVNACFAVASNRRSLEDANDQSLKVEWNSALVMDPLPRSYLNAILTLIRVVPVTEQNRHILHILFPSYGKTCHRFWQEFTNAFYEQLLRSSSSMPVLWSDCPLKGNHWISGDQAVFLVDHRKYHRVEMFDKAVSLAALCGYHAVEQPEGMKDIFANLSEKSCNVLTFRGFCEEVLFAVRGKGGFTEMLQLLLECEESDLEWCMELLRTHEIVPTSANTFVTALKLIDRNALHLSRLYTEEDGRFPSECIDEKHHRVLRLAGMAWKKIGIEDVLERARSIGELHFDSPDLVRSRIAALFAYLAAPEAELIPGNSEWISMSQLRDVAFLPALGTTVNDVFPLQGNDVCIQDKPQSASELWPMKYLNVVGSVCLLVDENQLPGQFLGNSTPMALLGLDDKIPSVGTVIDHLNQVVDHVQSSTFIMKGSVVDVIVDIYEFLLHHLSEVNTSDLPEHWVYVDGHGFVSPMCVTFESHPCGSLSPYRFVLDKQLLRTSKQLFSKIGKMRDQLTSVDLIEVLHEVQKEAEQKNNGELTDDRLHMCTSILLYIKSNLVEVKDSNLDILLPTAEKRLMPAKNCIFCDQEFLTHARRSLRSSKFGVPVHQDVTGIAEALGAKPLSQVLLKPGHVKFKFTQKGQNEPLTTRLKNILREYPEGLTVLKELVQNADDAGATEVRILLDFRNHGTSSLFNEKMKDWQGPALWCFNDAAFTEEDFENIFKLAGATKQGEAGKIGRFGLGFCSVYNLTDVPSFVSCRKLVILDPHVENLGSHLANIENPGITVDFVDEQDDMDVYIDQLKPYDGIFGCQMALNRHQAMPFPHTLFRFPLRNQTTADRSEISKSVYDKQMVLSLMSELQEEAEKLLLFLQAVRKISVYQLDGEACSAQDMRCLFSVETEHVKSISKESDESSTVNRGLLKSLVNRGILDSVSSSSHREMATCSMTISVRQEQSWLGCMGKKPYQHHWIVCSCLGHGGSESVSLARSSEGRKEGVMPWGGVALQVKPAASGEEQFLLNLDGRVFCFLPIPQPTNLPVHINGYFAVASSRRNIEDTTDGRFETKWNRSLLGDPVPCAYLHALEGCLQQTGLHSPSRLGNEVVSFFPPLTHRGSLWDHLGISFLEQLVKPDAPALFWTEASGGHWVNASAAQFLHRANFGKDYSAAVSVLQDLGVAAVSMPTMYREEVEKFPHVIDFVQFFTKHFFPNVKHLSQDVCAQFLKLLLDWRAQNRYQQSWCDQLIASYKCVPASNGSLQRPSYLVHPRSNWKVLFTPEDGRFLASWAEFSSAHWDAFVELGMALDMLTDDVIAERAHSVHTLSVEDGAKRAKDLLRLLGTNWHPESASKSIKEELRSARFLPVAPKPGDYLLPWHSDESKVLWTSANNAHNFGDRWLVGSHACVIDNNNLELLPSASVSKLLSLPHKAVQCETVLSQLSTILKTFVHCAEQPFLHTSDAEVSISPCVPDVTNNERQFLTKVTERVYRALNGFVSKFYESASEKRIKEILEGRAWIWQGDCFVTAEAMAFSTELAGIDGSRPFFNQVPSLLKDSCSTLLGKCGVVQTYTVDYYLKVMEMLYCGYAGRKANDRHRKLLIKMTEIIDELHNCSRGLPLLSHDSNLLEVDVTKIVLPSHTGHLYYTTELSFYDTPWLPLDELDEDEITFVDSTVPFPLAEAVGIRRGRDNLVDSDDIGEDFGQTEDLIDRLSGILEKYPADVSILKELVQNADDAQATAIHFVLDTQTSYPTEKLLNHSENWSKLLKQPALCVFNNRPFSEDDIRGISKLGRGSKRDDPLTTGRFGIGFNAVYHLTDCPSFLSRGHHGKPQDFCMFDPLLCYDPRATASKPGRRYKLNEKKEKMFGDQFLPYLGDKLPEVQQAEEGSTVFRFPLRPNIFCGKTLRKGGRWSTEGVLTLLLELRASGKEMLLFLNNLQSLRVSVICNGQLSTFFEVSREVSRLYASLPALVGCRKPTAEQLLNGPFQKTFTMSLKEVNVKETRGSSIKELIESCRGNSLVTSTKWLIHRSVGIESYNIPEEQLSGQQKGAVTKNQFLHIRQVASSEKAVRAALDYGLLPRAGIAAPLQLPKSQRLSLYHYRPTGQVFCTLPTTIQSGFVPHIDGHFTLDDSRKRLNNIEIFYSSGNKAVTDLPVQAWWNFWILDHALVPAYNQLLLEARGEVEVVDNDDTAADESQEEATDRLSSVCGAKTPLSELNSSLKVPLSEPHVSHSVSSANVVGSSKVKTNIADCRYTDTSAVETMTGSRDWYYALFPRWSECSDDFWKTLCRELYVYMARQQACVLASQQQPLQWFPLAGENCGIFHFRLKKLLLQLLLDVGLPLTSAPYLLFCELRDAKAQLTREVTPVLVTEHIKRKREEYVARQSVGKAKATVEHVAELLLYCLKDWKRLFKKPSSHDAREADRPTPLLADQRCDELNKVLQGLPLLLTEHNTLKAFSCSNPVIITRFVGLLPNCSDDLMNAELFKCVGALLSPVTLQNHTPCTCVVMPLSVKKVADNLLQLWPFLLAGSASPALWCFEDRNPELEKWLCLLWEFLKEVDDLWEKIQEALVRFCLVPVVTCKSTENLQLLATGEVPLAICFGQDSRKELEIALWKLGLPRLAFDRLTDDSGSPCSAVRKVCEATIKLDNYSMLLEGLHNVQSADLQSDLSMNEARLVLNHLINCCGDPAIKLNSGECNTLTSLRIFVSVTNKLVSLGDINRFFQVPAEMPQEECELWHHCTDIQVLKQMDEVVVRFITGKLKKHQVSLRDVYIEAILPQLLKMSRQAQLSHLRYIRDFVLHLCEQSQGQECLIKSLQAIPFVDTQTKEERRTPCELFTPKEDVFKEFISASFLLGETWLTDKWYSFLVKLGLNINLARPWLVKFAKAVEKTSFGTTDVVKLPVTCPPEEKVKHAACILLSSATDIFNDLKRCIAEQSHQHRSSTYRLLANDIEEAHTYLQHLKEIRFIFPEDAHKDPAMCLRNVLGESNPGQWLFRFIDGSKPVHFSGSGRHYERNLLWTQCSILPKECNRLVNTLCGQENLDIHSPPPLKLVINHLTAICRVLSEGSILAKKTGTGQVARQYLHNIFNDIYKFLNSHLEAAVENTGAIQALRNVPCILVDDDRQLVYPTQVTQDTLPENLSPYLTTLPTDFALFQKLMACVGVTRTPTAKQYAVVLEQLHHATGGIVFTNKSKPNEFVRVKFASKELIALLLKEEATEVGRTSSLKGRAAKPEQQTASELEPLYLPANCIPESDRNNMMLYSQCCLVRARDAIFNNDAFWISQRIKCFDRIQYVLTRWKSGNERPAIPSALGVRKLTEAVKERILPDLVADVNCVWDSSRTDWQLSAVHVHQRIRELYTLLMSVEFAEGMKRIIHHHGMDVQEYEGILNQLQQCKFIVVRTIRTVLEFQPVDESAAPVKIPGSTDSQNCFFLCNHTTPTLTLFVQELEEDCETTLSFAIDVVRTISMLVVGNEKHLGEMYDLINCKPESVHATLDKRKVTQYGEISEGQNKERDPPLGSSVPIELLDLADDPAMPFSVGEYVVYQIPGREPDHYILVRIVDELTTSEEAAKGPLHRRFMVEVDMEGSQEEVSVTDLFKFPTPDSFSAPESADRQLVVSSDSPSGYRSTTQPDQTLEDAIREIRKQVHDAFQLSEAKRKSVLRRLYLMWHPDKNDSAKTDLYTKAFQFLQNEIHHWEEHRRGSPEEETARWTSSSRGQPHCWNEFERTFRNYFRPSYSHGGGYSSGGMDQSYYRRYREWRNASSSSYTNFYTTSRHEAQRWLDQVESDFSFVQHHVQEGTPAGNAQACFMAQQVVEKALKAALYASSQGLHVNLLPKHDVCSLAIEFESACLGCLSVTKSASTVLDYYLPTRYPNRVSQRCLPCEMYSHKDAEEALSACRQVLHEVRNYIRRRQSSV